NSDQIQGQVYEGVYVKKPSVLKELSKDCIIIITTKSYNSVIVELKEKGYKPGVDFFCSPYILNMKIHAEFKEIDKKILFTSPDIVTEDINAGGGLYHMDLKTKCIEKKISGKFRDFSIIDNKIYVIDEFKGIMIYNMYYEYLENIPGIPNGRMCGLSFNVEENLAFIVNSELDSVSVINMITKEKVRDIFISKNSEDKRQDKHHLNDVCYYKGYIFVSMFSFSGLFKSEVCDGGIVQINYKTGEMLSNVITDKWMPHTVKFINNEIVFIESILGNVYKGNNKIMTQISGFIRGLDFDGKFWYLGQSEHRYYDRLDRIKNNIQINCGINIFDNASKASRFFNVDNVTNIHSLKVID
ncbi:DUF4915 domain-containing protein, partial [Candidatus Dependentiae bacterium]|nr:DUF4915 domain-containing protein [Candidatus Dependentiae bacterium]